MKLYNIQKGYAEFEWTFEGHTYYGYVKLEEFVVKTDFEKDKIITTDRWVIRLNEHKYLTYPCYPVGRITGYKTRQEALAAARAYIREENANVKFK